MKNSKETPSTCSFCEKQYSESTSFVVGKEVRICENCIDACHQALSFDQRLKQNESNKPQKHFDTIPIPEEIKSYLDTFVIGQQDAKIALAVGVYNHYKRLNYFPKKDDVELEKSNLLFLGPTGTGKTLLAQSIAKHLQVPFAITDATTLTEAGYVGEDVDNIIVRLLQVADYDINKTERGIIYIDEIDKISKTSGGNPSITRDVSGEGVQQALLKIIEGTIVSIPPKGGRKHPEQPLVQINTKNILFLCGGAFDGLEEIIKKRVSQKSIGFIQKNASPEVSSYLEKVAPEDLIKFGLIPELIGRIPLITHLNVLDEKSLLKIMTEPKNAIIKQYKKMFSFDGVELSFIPAALKEIANQAIKRGTGARGLRSIMEKLLTPIMFLLPTKKNITQCVIHKKVVTENQKPIYK